jgi:hypothetical protein
MDELRKVKFPRVDKTKVNSNVETELFWLTGYGNPPDLGTTPLKDCSMGLTR